MQLISGIAATIERETAGPAADPTEQDVMTVLIAAFPPMMGQYGIEIEHIDGPSWLVTVPSASWEAIEEVGYFEYGTRLSDGSRAKLQIEAPVGPVAA